MRSISHLYRVQGKTLEELDLEQVYPIEIIYFQQDASASLATRHLAQVKDYDSDEEVLVNLSKLVLLTTLVEDALNDPEIVSTPDPAHLTWEILGRHITDQMIMGYSSKVPDFKDASRSIRFVQLLNDGDFEISYCMRQTPEDRNMSLRRWQLKDLAVGKLNPKNKINLNNCLVSVNGCLSLPSMYKEEIIIPRGAEFIHNNTKGKTASVTLLDLNQLGSIQTVPFSKCEYRIRSGREQTTGTVTGGTIVPGKAIEIKLPKGVSIHDKQIWLVFGHSLFFGDPLQINSDTSVTMIPHALPVGRSLLKTQYHAHQYNKDTDILSTDTSVDEYINATAWQADHFGAFFIIIDTKELYIRKTPTKQYAESDMFHAVTGTNGLLYDQRTAALFDHTCQQFLTITELYSMDHNELSYPVIDPFGIDVAVESLHPFYKQFIPTNDPDMCVLEIIRA